MTSSPIEILAYTLLLVGLASFFVWIAAKSLMTDVPFPLDPTEVPRGTHLTIKQRVINGLRWLLYAWLWLGIISFAFGTPVAIMTPSAETPDWLAVVSLVIIVVTWIIILCRRVSLRWPLTGTGLCMVAMGGLLLNVMAATGLGKLLIMSFGRANVFTPSRLRAEKRRVRPRGLVEGFENE